MKRKRLGTARIVLVGIIDEELKAIRDVGAFTQALGRYYVPALAANNKYDIAVCRADSWGNLASGEAASQAIEDLRPYFVFLVGI
ncbi:MAG TPA: hypothetical protein VGJ30_20230, partial [Candidatus Angelobacter sp.]